MLRCARYLGWAGPLVFGVCGLVGWLLGKPAPAVVVQDIGIIVKVYDQDAQEITQVKVLSSNGTPMLRTTHPPNAQEKVTVQPDRPDLYEPTTETLIWRPVPEFRVWLTAGGFQERLRGMRANEAKWNQKVADLQKQITTSPDGYTYPLVVIRRRK